MTNVLTSVSNEVIVALQTQLNNDTVLATALQSSLEKAQDKGHKHLNQDLYQALDNIYQGKGWPLTTDDYLSYLIIFGEIIPSENTQPAYTAWNNNDQQNGYSQEIYDRLCHFYWLVDQKIEVEGNTITLQQYENGDFKFADWLVSYNTSWGEFLDTPASISPESIASFKRDLQYHTEDSSDDEPNWTSFNKFFYRKLNPTKPDGTPMRPIANPENNLVICAPADCTYKQYYNIDADGNVGGNDGVTLKKTHTFGNINTLLDESKLADCFYNGTFIHYFLSPFDYHRFHSPVKGKVLEARSVMGQNYLAVNIEPKQKEFDAPDSSEDGYEFNQARGILIVETKDIGKVAVLPIGMAQESSVIKNPLTGTEIKKGDEFGHFAFGGSDIIMLFEKSPEELYFIQNNQAQAFHFKYGEAAVFWGK
jgi:phosphatidylserine decarboxylase precursor